MDLNINTYKFEPSCLHCYDERTWLNILWPIFLVLWPELRIIVGYKKTCYKDARYIAQKSIKNMSFQSFYKNSVIAHIRIHTRLTALGMFCQQVFINMRAWCDLVITFLGFSTCVPILDNIRPKISAVYWRTSAPAIPGILNISVSINRLIYS